MSGRHGGLGEATQKRNTTRLPKEPRHKSLKGFRPWQEHTLPSLNSTVPGPCRKKEVE